MKSLVFLCLIAYAVAVPVAKDSDAQKKADEVYATIAKGVDDSKLLDHAGLNFLDGMKNDVQSVVDDGKVTDRVLGDVVYNLITLGTALRRDSKKEQLIKKDISYRIFATFNIQKLTDPESKPFSAEELEDVKFGGNIYEADDYRDELETYLQWQTDKEPRSKVYEGLINSTTGLLYENGLLGFDAMWAIKNYFSKSDK